MGTSKINWDKTFALDDGYTVSCGWQKTNHGFRHLAVVRELGMEIGRAKACYYNRTWESYEYQSVLHVAIKRTFVGDVAERYCDKVDGKGRENVNSELGLIAGIAKLGEVLCNNQKEKNAWKLRMLKAGLENRGLDIPDDFDGLDEAEKARRLDGAINALVEVP